MATRKNTAPKAPSADSVIVQARELEPTIRKLLAGINAVLDRPDAKPAANAEDAAPDLSDIHGVIMDECNALLVLRDSFSDFGQITIGHTITEEDADRLAAINNQLHACRKRLADLSRVTDDASVNYDLTPNEHERARLRLVAGEAGRPVAEAPESADPVPGDVPAIPVADIEEGFGRYPEPLSTRIMNAAGIVGTVRNALDEDRAAESAALAVAVEMLHKIDDDLDRACWKATEAWDRAHPDHPDAIERRRVLESMQPGAAS